MTRFECPNLITLLLFCVLHVRVKLEVRRRSRGLIGSKALVDWRRRTLLSISLWQDVDSLYSMGGVPRHIRAARLPRRFGVTTACGIYCFAGDWRRVLFGTVCEPRDPLRH